MQTTLFADTIAERFDKFHTENPHVYRRLVKLAREWKEAGHKKCSMDMLFHLLRWHYGIKTAGDPFKLNDHFTSRYTRLICANEPDLADLFEVRSLHAI